MLLIVPKRVDCAHQTALVLRQTKMLRSEPYALVEPDGPPLCPIQDPDALFHEASLQQHLEGVLKVEKHGRYPTVVIEVIECPGTPAEGGHSLGL